MALLAGNFRAVFWFACLPAVLSVLTLAFGVKEPEARPKAAARPFPLKRAELARLGRPFWLTISIVFLLLLPRMSDSFMLLRAANLGLADKWVPLVMAAMNFVYAPLSLPAGRLSDRLGPARLIFAGFAVLLAAQLLLFAAAGPALVFAGAMVWGMHYALTQGALSALIANSAAEDLRGTAFGVFQFVAGLAALIGSSAGGLIWDGAGPPATFLAAAVTGVIGLAAMWYLTRKARP
jgi:predicted MFS family arabinose efflux permease